MPPTKFLKAIFKRPFRATGFRAWASNLLSTHVATVQRTSDDGIITASEFCEPSAPLPPVEHRSSLASVTTQPVARDSISADADGIIGHTADHPASLPELQLQNQVLSREHVLMEPATSVSPPATRGSDRHALRPVTRRGLHLDDDVLGRMTGRPQAPAVDHSVDATTRPEPHILPRSIDEVVHPVSSTSIHPAGSTVAIDSLADSKLDGQNNLPLYIRTHARRPAVSFGPHPPMKPIKFRAFPGYAPAWEVPHRLSDDQHVAAGIDDLLARHQSTQPGVLPPRGAARQPTIRFAADPPRTSHIPGRFRCYAPTCQAPGCPAHGGMFGVPMTNASPAPPLWVEAHTRRQTMMPTTRVSDEIMAVYRRPRNPESGDIPGLLPGAARDFLFGRQRVVDDEPAAASASEPQETVERPLIGLGLFVAGVPLAIGGDVQA